MKLYASQLNPPPSLHLPKTPHPTKSREFTPPKPGTRTRTRQKLQVEVAGAGNGGRVRSRLVLEAPRKWAVLGGASVSFGVLLVLLGPQEAWAFGLPDGPLVEEFWDNMRRYALYVLTVSTGALYTVFQPILELLKNPITALLILVLVLGGAFLVSQVLTAMVGISDFSYNYGGY